MVQDSTVGSEAFHGDRMSWCRSPGIPVGNPSARIVVIVPSRWFGCARDTNQVARAGPGAQDSAAPRYIPGQLWLPVTPRQASRQLIHPRSRVEQNVLGGCRENSVRGAFQWLL